ncbi:MAG: ATP-dependent nuclease [Fusobacteriaceae bacterium]
MHKLSYLEVKNFKSIKNSKFRLSDFTPIIGYNNAGKSNILEATFWLLNKSVLSKNIFNNSDEDIEVIGEITGITEKILGNLNSHRSSIEKYIIDGKLKIKRVHPKLPCKVSDIKLYIYFEKEWKVNPVGIDGALKALYPEPIVIKAMDNTEDDIGKFKTTSTIGKLIGEIIKPIETKYSSHISECMNNISSLLSISGDKRVEELNCFDDQINEKLNDIFPDLKLRLDISTPTITDIFKSGSLKIYEGKNNTEKEIEEFGTGTKRTIQMTLIRQLAEMKKGEISNSTTLLLVDEPELYLHPQAIEQLRISLKQLSNVGYQVIFTTHSSQMVSSDDIANTIILRKCDINGTYPRKTLHEAINQIKTDHENQIELVFNLSNSNQILFSENVVLAEGKTEKKLLPFLYEKITNKTLLLDKICIISQNGANNTQKTQKILGIMGLKNKAIVDLDFVFTNGVKLNYLKSTDSDITQCKAIMKRLEEKKQIILNSSTGLPQAGNGKKAEDFYKIFAEDFEAKTYINNLHNKMKDKNIWVWNTGAIETKLNLENKTERTWANFKSSLKDKSSCDIAKLYPDLVKLFDWIKI